MKIGMLTHYYDPEGGAAATPGVLARALSRRGHDVQVLTGFPNYPSGEIAAGYRLSPYQREVMDGVTIHRVPIYPSHDDSATRRIANYMSFGLASIPAAGWLFRDCDVQFVYFSPATTAMGALPLALSRRTPAALLIQDMWPETVTASGFLSPRVAEIADRILVPACNQLYRASSSIAVTSPGMVDVLAERGVPRSKLSFIPNWSDESAFRPASRDDHLRHELGLDRRFTLMYAGNLGDLQDLDTAIDAARILRDREDISFSFVGSGVRESELRERVAELDLNNVRFVPSQPFSRMADILAQADCQLISLRDIPILRSTLPSKIQANLASGSPVIGAVAGDAARVLRDSGSGVVVQPGDPAALAEAVRRMADLTPDQRALFASRAREFYLSSYSEEVGASALESLLRSTAQTRRCTPETKGHTGESGIV